VIMFLTIKKGNKMCQTDMNTDSESSMLKVQKL